MKASARFASAALFALGMSTLVKADDATRKHLYVCRSPVLAFDFWNGLQEMQRKGVTVTPKIAQEVCNGIRAGDEPRCLRVEADGFKPVASGYGGAMAMSDGKTKVWFHNPDTLGWVHPDYYVQFVNAK
ncbi:hypothetical protein [Ralstonia pseudosolanacearum]|uniref:hypothetical protein n=1 Tax=Ralstonia pseudosolanacearum TaxID=1310165 RepID=UPI0007EB9FA5|nr:MULTISPECIES: hypothetical protein [Ralstonia]UZF35882.1 hypothetical protein LGV81_04155 [Ralstonia sp. RS647]